MTSMHLTDAASDAENFPRFPDLWAPIRVSEETSPLFPWPWPLDASHELPAAAAPIALLSPTTPIDCLQLPAPLPQ